MQCKENQQKFSLLCVFRATRRMRGAPNGRPASFSKKSSSRAGFTVSVFPAGSCTEKNTAPSFSCTSKAGRYCFRSIYFPLFALLLCQGLWNGVICLHGTQHILPHLNRVTHLIYGAGNFRGVHPCRLYLYSAYARRQARLQGRARLLPIFRKRLHLAIQRFHQALLAKSKRGGKRHIDMRVKALCIPYGQPCALQRALHHALKVQQRDICRFTSFGKPHPNGSQSKPSPTGYLRRSPHTRGCTAVWCAPASPFRTRG